MRYTVKYNQNQLRDYSSLFSRSEALSWFKKDFRSINYKIKRYDENWHNYKNATYLDYLKYVYHILESQYQNEYILKNSFLNEWLIQEIGSHSSQIFNEFRVGNSIADLVMFNGSSKLFEIKTEYDSDSRLPVQLYNYQKAFNQIFLIVPVSKLKLYEKYNERIGLISFDGNRIDKFRLTRKAENNLNVDPSVIMQILHTEEYKSVVKLYYGKLPKMTSFNQFNICQNLINKIPTKKLNTLFINQMKNRDFNNNISSRYYKEFNQLSLALKLNKPEKKIMIDNLKTLVKV